jgi:uncharacterized protein YndB with AHSA1/START domain
MSLSALSLNNDALIVSWLFQAPIETVWSGLTDPVRQSRWLGTAVESDIRPGGILVIDHGEGYLCRSNVTEVAAPHRLAMTWEFPDEPRSRIAVALHESDNGTAAELTHTGLEDLAPSYGPGWTTHLTYLEAAVQGDTIPPSQFWKLHATFTALHNGPESTP